jgi:DNA-binding PadR family transcriptional regulator
LAAIKRVTTTTLKVLQALHEAGEPTWGVRIMQTSGLLSGTVYQILERLERGGLVTSEWEADSDRRGPRRRLYQLTETGEEALNHVRAIREGVEAAKALAKAQAGLA